MANDMNTETVKFACPHCGQHIKAEPDTVGETVACPGCNRPLLISSPPSSEPVLAPAATNTSRSSKLRVALVVAVALVAVCGGIAFLLRPRDILETLKEEHAKGAIMDEQCRQVVTPWLADLKKGGDGKAYEREFAGSSGRYSIQIFMHEHASADWRVDFSYEHPSVELRDGRIRAAVPATDHTPSYTREWDVSVLKEGGKWLIFSVSDNDYPQKRCGELLASVLADVASGKNTDAYWWEPSKEAQIDRARSWAIIGTNDLQCWSFEEIAKRSDGQFDSYLQQSSYWQDDLNLVLLQGKAGIARAIEYLVFIEKRGAKWGIKSASALSTHAKATPVSSTRPVDLPASEAEKKAFTSAPPSRISIALPARWEQVDDPEAVLRTHNPAAGASDGYDERVVMYFPKVGGQSLEDVYEILSKALSEDGFVFVNRSSMSVAGMEGVYSVWDLTDEARRDLRGVRALFNDGKRYVLVNCFALRSEFEKWEPVFKKGIRSMVLVDAHAEESSSGRQEPTTIACIFSNAKVTVSLECPMATTVKHPAPWRYEAIVPSMEGDIMSVSVGLAAAPYDPKAGPWNRVHLKELSDRHGQVSAAPKFIESCKKAAVAYEWTSTDSRLPRFNKEVCFMAGGRLGAVTFSHPSDQADQWKRVIESICEGISVAEERTGRHE